MTRKKNNSDKWFKLGKFDEVPTIKQDNGGVTLALPEKFSIEDLPGVSVVTITKDRDLFAAVMLYNWNHFRYPRDKLEWVILDDSEDPEQNLGRYLPDDPNIRYVRLDKHYDVATKRNMAVRETKYEFIAHMDDDDYYFPDSILAKVRVLLHYDKEAVHSAPFGVYDMMEQTSYIFSLERDCNDVAEATLLYKKRYWRNNHFKSKFKNGAGEGRAFVNKNFKDFIKLHFFFNMISITHAQNLTGHNRRFINERKDEVQTGDFRDVFPESFKDVLENVRQLLLERVGYEQPQIEYDSDEENLYAEMRARQSQKSHAAKKKVKPKNKHRGKRF